MIKTSLEEGYLFLAAGIVCIIAVIIRFLLSLSYSYWVKASNSMDKENSKRLERLKKRFETMYQMNLGVKNVDIFVDKYLNAMKLCGLYLSTWESISGQVRVLCGVIGIGAGIIGLHYDCGQLIMLSTIGISTGGIAFTLLVDNFSGLAAKKSRLKVNMSDYFENYLKVRLELSEEHTEHAASSFDKIYEAVNESSYNTYVNDKLEKAEKKYLTKRMKLEKKMQEEKLKKEKKEVFAKIKKEKKNTIEEIRMKEEQEAMAEMKRKRAEKQKERKEKALNEMRQRILEENEVTMINEDQTMELDMLGSDELGIVDAGMIDARMAETAASLDEELKSADIKRIPTAMDNKLIEEVLKEFLV